MAGWSLLHGIIQKAYDEAMRGPIDGVEENRYC